MTQNIYDKDDFFQAYSQLPRSLYGLAGAPEWPTLRSMLPDLNGSRVLDLGCGFGWFCRWARENGAASVVGIDVSEKMLTRARDDTHDAAITYRREDLEKIILAASSFDLVYSSLAFHYLENFDRLVAEVYRALATQGALVFSVEHPINTAPSNPNFSTDKNGHTIWPLDSYLDEGPRLVDWLTKDVLKQHRTLATYLKILRDHAFTITHLEEWGPTKEQVAKEPTWSKERTRPLFLLMTAKRQ